MTPTASTSAGRQTTKRANGAQRAHPRKLRRPLAQPAPRRFSGPVRGRERVAARPGPVTPFGARAAAFVRSLPDRALIDRLVRGRAWIPVLGVLLAGIVAMQVEVLKLGASMGRALQRGSALSSQNELLRASVASLADDQRIERLAAQMGMVMPAPTAVGFLQAQPRQNVSNALASIHAPDASSFLTQLSAAQTATAVDTTGSQLTSSGSAPRSASTATTSASTTGVDSGATTATQTETQTTAAQTTTAPTQTETTTTPTQTATSAGG